MSTRGTILVVDDEASSQPLVLALKHEGYVVAEARSGREALALYPEIEPDLVLLDVCMPELNGFDTCRHLVARYGDECAPVIFYTGAAGRDEVTEGFSAGGADYLEKPSPLKEIYARVRAHIQNHLLAKQQKSLVEQLRRGSAAKNRFIGMVAHDMRNPLVSIRGFAEFLLDGTLGPMPTQQRALVSIIQQTSQLMLKTLNELLDVATIEAGQLKLATAPHNLIELLGKAVAQAAISARAKRTRILFEPQGSAFAVRVDQEKIRQVIDNLLSNAIKFSPPGSTIVVGLHWSTEANTCEFTVRDNGPGIPEHEQGKLFKQVSGLAVEPHATDKNSGLALIICRNIVEAHGGRISAENLPNRGCEFRVVLPLEAAKATAAA